MKIYRRLIVVAVLTSGIAATLGVPPASAALKSWVARVVFVSDGDTFTVDTNKDGKADYTVRMIGLNTPEGHLTSRTTWKGMCHSQGARNRLNKLIGGKLVELRASNFKSTGSQNRKLRFVHLRNRARTDVNALMLKESWAVPYPNDIEPSRNKAYIALARKAATAATKRRVWNPNACKAGPASSLKVRLHWDANGNDELNLNDEYVRIENPTPSAYPLAGWRLRESSAFYYYFGSTVKVPAYGSVIVHTGKVPSGRTNGWSETDALGRVHKHYYWSLSRSVFANAKTPRGVTLGDGAYLYDRHGDLRHSMEYPCLTNCTDPLGAKLELTANYNVPNQDNDYLNGEWVSVRNTSTTPVKLDGYMVESDPWTYEVPAGTTLNPGDRLRIYGGRGTNSRLQQYWGNTGVSMFAEPSIGGDSVMIRTMETKVVKTFRWPCSTCAKPAVRIENRPNADNTVVLRNTGSSSVDLRDWLLQFKDQGEQYDFKVSRILAPNAAVTVEIGTGSDDADTAFWAPGHPLYGAPVQTNGNIRANGSLSLFTPQRNSASCVEWGTDTSCP